jgi:16S rRNA (adenine1518-N6/adenine1519-N6)-dimethyltransferase
LEQLPPIKDILKKYNLNADKKLGQNFLFDQNITDKIARASGSLEGKTVIEIGPGPGLLTRSILAAGAARVIAIEKDPRCITALNDYLVPASDGRLEIIDADALQTNISDIIDGGAFPISLDPLEAQDKVGGAYLNVREHTESTRDDVGEMKGVKRVKIIANLPYNIATELLFKWLETPQKFESMTLMFQREVAMRIMAKPRTKDYGRVSIKAQWLCDVEHEFDLPPEAFFPPPKVTSSVITLTPLAKPLAEADEATLEKICKATFGQRRKTLRASLKQICQNPAEILAQAEIGEMQRPEELTVEEFCRLAREFGNHESGI